MIVYLSGPVSLGGTSPASAIRTRVAAFHRAAVRLRALGYEVISPVEVAPQESWEAFMRVLIPEVCRADVVAVLPDWLESRGAVLEVFVARQVGVRVMPAAGIVLRAADAFPRPGDA